MCVYTVSYTELSLYDRIMEEGPSMIAWTIVCCTVRFGRQLQLLNKKWGLFSWWKVETLSYEHKYYMECSLVAKNINATSHASKMSVNASKSNWSI